MSSGKKPRRSVRTLEDCFSTIAETGPRRHQVRQAQERLHSIDRMSSVISKYRIDDETMRKFNLKREKRTEKAKGDARRAWDDLMDALPEMTRVFRDSIRAAHPGQEKAETIIQRLINECVAGVARFVDHWRMSNAQALGNAVRDLDNNAASQRYIYDKLEEGFSNYRSLFLDDLCEHHEKIMEETMKDLESTIQQLPDILQKRCAEFVRGRIVVEPSNLLSSEHYKVIRECILLTAQSMRIQKATDWAKRLNERLESIYPSDIQDVFLLSAQTRTNDLIVDDFVRCTREMIKSFEPHKLKELLYDLEKKVVSMNNASDAAEEKLQMTQALVSYLQLQTSINKLENTLDEYKKTVLDPEFSTRLEAGLISFDEVLENHEQFIRYIVNIQAALNDEQITQEHLQNTFDESTQLSTPVKNSIEALTRQTIKQMTSGLEKRLEVLENQRK